jgi:hypothetical protein
MRILSIKKTLLHSETIRKSLFPVSLVVCICWGVGCQSRTSSVSTGPFPRTNEVSGWAMVGETRTFTADNLYEYIDGAADKFTQAGFEDAQTTDYRFQNTVDATADVYTMKTPEGAGRVFEEESSPDSQALKLGDRAQISEGTLLFTYGRFYVKVVAFGNPPGIAGGIETLGRAIEAKLPGS